MSARNGLCLLLAAVSVIATGSAALAENALSDKLSISTGVMTPMKESISDACGSSWQIVTLSYKLSESKSSEHLLSVGYAASLNRPYQGWDHSFYTSLKMVPVTYTCRTKPGRGHWYSGLGAGLYHCSFSTRNVSLMPYESDLVEYGARSEYEVHILGGFQLNDRTSAEVTYAQLFRPSESADDQFGGFVSFTVVGSF